MTTDTNDAVTSVSATTLRASKFDQARHGYDRRQVEEKLGEVANHLEASETERRELREEVTRLRSENEHLRDVAPSDDDVRMEISERAVELLTRAQKSADTAVAEAESYAKDLVATAREQYRDIIHRAEQSAAQTAEQMAHAVQTAPAAQDLPPATGSESIPEVEYVRTFARVAQVQLHSVLAALTAEVDKLNRKPRPESPPQAPVQWQSTAESWSTDPHVAAAS